MSNSLSCAYALTKQMRIPITYKKLYDEFFKHPDQVSLLAISDVFTTNKIKNNAYKINPKNIDQIPTPFIAHTTFGQDEFVVVNKVDEKMIYLTNEKWTNKGISLDQFKNDFSGIILTIEPSSEGKRYEIFKYYLNISRRPIFIFSFLSCCLFILSGHSNLLSLSRLHLLPFFIFKTLGLTVTVLLLIQNIDNNNPIIKRLCKDDGQDSCNSILSSKASNAFWGLSWSEIGFFYFSGTWLFLLFGKNSTPILDTLLIVNVLSLPYTFYSIYYQGKIAKQWCILCCTIQALLWLEFISLYYSGHAFSFVIKDFINPVVIFTLLIFIIIPFTLWLLIKPFLSQLQELPVFKEQLHSFKFNSDIFNRVLSRQFEYKIPDDEWCIVLGNKDAENVITMVTNPYCPPCARAHKQLDELLNDSNYFKAQIIFTGKNTEDDYQRPISRHLMALANLDDKRICENAIRDWYDQAEKNYNSWSKVYPIASKEAGDLKLQKQLEWCLYTNIKGTPTILLNGFELPEQYQLADIKYILNK